MFRSVRSPSRANTASWIRPCIGGISAPSLDREETAVSSLDNMLTIFGIRCKVRITLYDYFILNEWNIKLKICKNIIHHEFIMENYKNLISIKFIITYIYIYFSLYLSVIIWNNNLQFVNKLVLFYIKVILIFKYNYFFTFIQRIF